MIVRALIFVTALLTFGASNSHAQEVIWMDYPLEGVNLGQGFNIKSGMKTYGTCVIFDRGEDKGLETTYELKKINSYIDTFSSLNIRGSGSLKMAVLEASAKLNFANSSRVKRNDSNYMFNGKIYLGTEHAIPIKNTAEDEKHASPTVGKITLNDDVAFVSPSGDKTDKWFNVTLCGDGFVSAVQHGLELNSLVDLSSTSAEDVATFDGQIKAKILGGLVKLKASGEGASTESGDVKMLSITSYMIGGSEYKLPRTLDDLNTIIPDLPTIAKNDPRPLRIAITPYSSIVDELSSISKIFNQTTENLIEAYFLNREAVARLDGALATLSRESTPAYFAPLSSIDLFEKQDVALSNMIEASSTLSAIRSSIVDPPTAKEIEAKIATRSADAGKEFEPLILRGVARDKSSSTVQSPPLDDNASDESNEGPEGLSDESSTALASAMEVYLYSLIADPIHIENALNGNVNYSKQVVQSALNIAAQDAVYDRDEALDTYRKKVDSVTRGLKKCNDEAEKRLSGWDNRVLAHSKNGEYPNDHFNRYIELEKQWVAECNKKYNVAAIQSEYAEQVAKFDESDQIKIKNREIAIQVIREFMSNLYYVDRFYPIRQSACEFTTDSVLCESDYSQVTSRFEDIISINDSIMKKLGASINHTPVPPGDADISLIEGVLLRSVFLPDN